jgi:hypothetical protein
MRIARLLLLGVIAAVAIAWGSAVFVDLSQAPARVAVRSFDGHVETRLEIHPAAVGVRYVIERQRGAPWSPEQATGAPDSPIAGDQRTAWATDAVDAPGEWLELSYAETIVPVEIEVYETFNPGAVSRVGVFDEKGRETIVFDGVDPTPPQAKLGVSRIPVPLREDLATRRVKLYLDSQGVPGWNEIDAVALIDRAGISHWATSARASTWYGSANYAPTIDAVTPLLPRWGGLASASGEFALGAVKAEQRIVEARGWPLPALWTEVPSQSIGTVLPLRPIPLGFAADAAILACVFALLSLLFTRPARFLKRASRMQHGQCLQCGYDLRYDFVGGCPECGWRREDAFSASTRTSSQQQMQTQPTNGKRA